MGQSMLQGTQQLLGSVIISACEVMQRVDVTSVVNIRLNFDRNVKEI